MDGLIKMLTKVKEADEDEAENEEEEETVSDRKEEERSASEKEEERSEYWLNSPMFILVFLALVYGCALVMGL